MVCIKLSQFTQRKCVLSLEDQSRAEQLIIKPGSVQAEIWRQMKWKKDGRAWRTTLDKESDMLQMDMQLYKQQHSESPL